MSTVFVNRNVFNIFSKNISGDVTSFFYNKNFFIISLCNVSENGSEKTASYNQIIIFHNYNS